MKSAVGVLATICLVGLSMAGCAPADPVEGGTGGQAPGTGGANPATGGNNGNNGSGGASTGGAIGSGSGGSVATGGRSSSGGMFGTGGGSGGGSGGASSTGSGGTGTGGKIGAGTGGAAGIMGGGGVGSAGSGGSAGSTAAFAPVASLLGNSCATGACHQGGAHVDLRNNAGLRSRLVSVLVSGTATMSACRTKTLVIPGNTASSVISQVVKATVSGCTGARMPDNCSTTSTSPRACLTAAQIATIDGWISAGAAP